MLYIADPALCFPAEVKEGKREELQLNLLIWVLLQPVGAVG